MDTPPPHGQTLLVGEGGFSFCVAMVTKWQAEKQCSVVATSLESEETIMKHCNATDNINWLRSKGVRVHLSVDGTCLHTCNHLSGERYSRVIFNFPHAGGKSNHKKNRALLNDFFASAVNVLDNNGQIMVTLCRGQGGTPADQPIRAWHDSWQVVSMAANSGLILVKTIPFCIEDYSTYTSTGFRSLDKAFHTENAVTHVFETATTVQVPDDSSGLPMTVRRRQFICPRYLNEKLHTIRQIERNSRHPFNRLYHRLRCAFLAAFNIEMNVKQDRMCPSLKCSSLKVGTMSDTRSTTTHLCSCDSKTGPEIVCRSDCCSSVSAYLLGSSIETNIKTVDDQFSENNISGLPTKQHNLEAKTHDTDQSASPDCPEYHFQSSLLDTLTTGLRESSNSSEAVCMHGPVFRPCVIQPNLLPVQCHMLISVPISTEINTIPNKTGESVYGFDRFVENRVKTCCMSNEESEIHSRQMDDTDITKLQTTVNVVVNALQHELGTVIEYKMKTEEDGMLINGPSVFLQMEEYECFKHGVFVSSAKYVGSVPTSTVDAARTDTDSMVNNLEIGEIYTVKSIKTKESMAVFILLLDDLSRLKYSIPDIRLLWSNDHRVLDQFMKMDSSTEHGETNKETQEQHIIFPDSTVSPSGLFKTPSLYPMTFTHDMSFWENDSIPFSEIQYCSIIRNFAGDNVISVSLIDRYTDTEAGKCKISCCYRLVFQSCDQCLSYRASWELQSIIRLEVQNHMGIVLR